MNASELDLWFVREVLPLEAILLQFFHHHWRNKSDIADLCQDVYVRAYEGAHEKIPNPTKPFVFAIARNLLIDRLRRERIVPIEAVADVEMPTCYRSLRCTSAKVAARGCGIRRFVAQGC